MNADPRLTVRSPDVPDHEPFTDPAAAVERLIALYSTASRYLCDRFSSVLASGEADAHYRAFYPEVRITTTSFASADTRLSFGHVAEPGRYSTSITRPDLFANYLRQQI
ncbi:MAG: AMP nucleosidase, partial [Bacteroidota bacterium]